jgi:hypothetical protein
LEPPRLLPLDGHRGQRPFLQATLSLLAVVVAVAVLEAAAVLVGY